MAPSPASLTKSCWLRVSQFANALQSCGVGKGDRVLIYMPMTIEGVVAMQACAHVSAPRTAWCSAAFGQGGAGAHHRRRCRGRRHRQLPTARRQEPPPAGIIDEAGHGGRKHPQRAGV